MGNRQGRRRPAAGLVALFVGLAVVVLASGCEDAFFAIAVNTLPGGGSGFAVAGSWQGTFIWASSAAVECGVTDPATALLAQTGGSVSGTLVTSGNCSGTRVLQGALDGTKLTGVVTEVRGSTSYRGMISGTATSSTLHVVVDELTSGSATIPGGTFDLKR